MGLHQGNVTTIMSNIRKSLVSNLSSETDVTSIAEEGSLDAEKLREYCLYALDLESKRRVYERRYEEYEAAEQELEEAIAAAVCYVCDAYSRTNNDNGECRFNPPIAAADGSISVWPRVDREDWCLKFSRSNEERE